MKTQILKSSMLALAGAVAIAAAGSASAMAPPYQACVYKGETQLDSGGGAPLTCWLNMVVKSDCDGNVVEITAAGPNPGDPNCGALMVGGFPWTSTLAGINSGTGSINTATTLPVSVGALTPSGFQPLAGGVVQLLGNPATTTPYTCDGNTVNLPDSVVVNPMGTPGNFGGSATFTGTLDRIVCGEHL